MITVQGISTLRNLTILSIQSNRLSSLGIPNSSSNRMPSSTTNDQTRDDSRTDTDIINGSTSEAITNNTNNNVIDNNDNNNISNLPLPLSFLTSLTELHVSHNALTSLNGLSTGPASLRILDISSNPLSSLAGIESLTNLEELWASNCHMDDWREVERGIGTEKSGKHALETVYLEGNPIQRKQPALYRGKVKLLVPGVRQIDACEFLGSHFPLDIASYLCSLSSIAVLHVLVASSRISIHSIIPLLIFASLIPFLFLFFFPSSLRLTCRQHSSASRHGSLQKLHASHAPKPSKDLKDISTCGIIFKKEKKI